MIRANHKRLESIFIRFYSDMNLKKHFKKVQVYADFDLSDKSILLVGNHFSWWDGFIAYFVNHHVLHKKFHAMMLETQLKPRMFLSRAGAFSIGPGNRDMVESIAYARDILSNQSNMVAVFPQGEIQSQHISPLLFKKGWLKMLNGLSDRVQIVFMCNLVDYFSDKKPSLHIYLKSAGVQGEVTHDKIERMYNEFFESCINRQKNNG